MSGLTENGFEIKTFEEILRGKEEEYVTSFGNVNLAYESLLGQTLRIDSTPIAELWLAALDVYNAQFADTATGISLDYACDAIGITRLRSTATRVNSLVSVVNNTTLPQGVEAKMSAINTIFKSDAAITIDNAACINSVIKVENNTEASYTITIDGTPFEYTPFIIDEVPQIVDGLIFLINNGGMGVTATPLLSESIFIQSDTSEEFAVTISSGLGITSVSNFLNFTSTTLGDIAVPAAALDTIVTPIIGWVLVYNPFAGDSGRDVETDNELRIRRSESLSLLGSGSVAAIKANLRNITGVTVADVVDNKTSGTVGDLPPHSFKCIVLGGSDQDIGKTIWLKKAAGIQEIGDIPVIIQDSEGVNHTIYFYRPVPLYIYANITLTLDASNTYPINGAELITAEILNIIKFLNVGEDVIYQSFFKAVYAVDGIESAVIEIGGTVNELVPPALSSSNVAVGSAEVAVSDNTKINVIIA